MDERLHRYFDRDFRLLSYLKWHHSRTELFEIIQNAKSFFQQQLIFLEQT
jgi:hypothetical protein